MPLKICVVGGGSTYTPELVDGIAQAIDAARGGRAGPASTSTAERREIVGDLAGRMLRHNGWDGQLTVTGDRDAALDGANFVLVQLRVGGQQARLVDETLPHEFGLIGQETTGPGGFAKALRTVPVVLDLAEEVARRAAPDAWIVDFTNPVGIVTHRAPRRGAPGHRAVQRGHRPPAAVRRAVRGRRRSRSSSSTSAQPPVVGARRPRRRRRPAGRADRGRRRRGGRDGRRPGRSRPRRAALPPTTCATTTCTDVVLREQLDGPHAGAGRHGHRARSCWSCTRTRARHEARAARAPRWRVLQRGGRAADRVTPRRARRRAGRRHFQRGAPCPTCRTTRSSRCRRTITRDGAAPAQAASRWRRDARPGRRPCARTRRWRSRRRCPGSRCRFARAAGQSAGGSLDGRRADARRAARCQPPVPAPVLRRCRFRGRAHPRSR